MINARKCSSSAAGASRLFGRAIAQILIGPKNCPTHDVFRNTVCAERLETDTLIVIGKLPAS